MPVTAVTTDADALTITVIAELAADPTRVWRLYEDPRQLERWWGPPGWPATFLAHELRAGGGSHYALRGAEGEEYHGVWTTIEVDAPRSFTVEDAFADADGAPNGELPASRMTVSLAPGGPGTVVTAVSIFASADALQQSLDMGLDDGLRQAMEQIDGILGEGPARQGG